MKLEKGTDSGKLFCPTETFIRETIRTGEDTDR